MGLLHEIQTSLIQEGASIGPSLLKLRLLASRLGSNSLGEWVKHEADGYPVDVPVPEYRKMSVSYTANFSGPFQSGIKNAPIPPYLIEKHAGKKRNFYEERRSVTGVDNILRSNKDGALYFQASNLILLLQGKVYEDYACNSVTGTIAIESFVELQSSVRNRILELTIKLEEEIPSVAAITVGLQQDVTKETDTTAVAQITNQVIHNYTEINNSGADARIVLSIGKGDTDAFVEALRRSGIPEPDAKEFAEIVSKEKPQSEKEPFGERARDWLKRNWEKFADGSWKIGVSAGTNLLTEAAMRYYGFK